MKQSKSGFTIVEIMIVVLVIGILASIVIVSYNQVQARSRDSKRKADVSNMIKALEIYYGDNGSYPIASTTNSSVGSIWYSSDTTSWNTFKTAMTGAIDIFPSDPSNIGGDVTSLSSAHNYAYYANTSNSCNVAAGQMYIIVYRYEVTPKESAIDGSCTSNNPGAAALAAGASYYISSHG